MSRSYDRVPPSGSGYYQGAKPREMYSRQGTHANYPPQGKANQNSWDQSWSWSIDPGTSASSQSSFDAQNSTNYQNHPRTTEKDPWTWSIDNGNNQSSQIHDKSDQYKKYPSQNERVHQPLHSQQFKHKQVTQSSAPSVGYQDQWQTGSQVHFANSQNSNSMPNVSQQPRDGNYQEPSTWQGTQYPNAQISSAYGTQQNNTQMTWDPQQEQTTWNAPPTSNFDIQHQNITQQYNYKPNNETSPPQNWTETNANTPTYWNQGDPNWNTPQQGWEPSQQQGRSTYEYPSKDQPPPSSEPQATSQNWYNPPSNEPKPQQIRYDYQNEEGNQVYLPQADNMITQQHKQTEQPYQDQYYGIPHGTNYDQGHIQPLGNVEAADNAGYGREPDVRKEIQYEQDLSGKGGQLPLENAGRIDTNVPQSLENKETIYSHEKEPSPHNLPIDQIPEQRESRSQSQDQGCYPPVENKETLPKSHDHANMMADDCNQEVIAPPPTATVISNIRLADPELAPPHLSYAAALKSEVQQKVIQPEETVQPSTPEPCEATIDDAPNQEVPAGPAIVPATREMSPLEQSLGFHLSLEDLPENLEKPEDVESLSKSWALRSQMRAPVVADSPSASLLDSIVDLPQVLLVTSPLPVQTDKVVLQDDPASAKTPSVKEDDLEVKDQKDKSAQLLENLQNLGIEEISTTRKERYRALPLESTSEPREMPDGPKRSPPDNHQAQPPPSRVNDIQPEAESRMADATLQKNGDRIQEPPQDYPQRNGAKSQDPNMHPAMSHASFQDYVPQRNGERPQGLSYAAQQDYAPQRNREHSQEPSISYGAQQDYAPQRSRETSQEPPLPYAAQKDYALHRNGERSQEPVMPYSSQQDYAPQRNRDKSQEPSISHAAQQDYAPQWNREKSQEPSMSQQGHVLERNTERSQEPTQQGYAPERNRERSQEPSMPQQDYAPPQWNREKSQEPSMSQQGHVLERNRERSQEPTQQGYAPERNRERSQEPSMPQQDYAPPQWNREKSQEPSMSQQGHVLERNRERSQEPTQQGYAPERNRDKFQEPSMPQQDYAPPQWNREKSQEPSMSQQSYEPERNREKSQEPSMSQQGYVPERNREKSQEPSMPQQDYAPQWNRERSQEPTQQGYAPERNREKSQEPSMPQQDYAPQWNRERSQEPTQQGYAPERNREKSQEPSVLYATQQDYASQRNRERSQEPGLTYGIQQDYAPKGNGERSQEQGYVSERNREKSQEPAMSYTSQHDQAPQRNARMSREPTPSNNVQRSKESSREQSPKPGFAGQRSAERSRDHSPAYDMHSTPQKHSRKSPYTELSSVDPYDSSPQHEAKKGDPREKGDVRRHSLEESPRRAKEGGYSHARRDSFDSQFSYRQDVDGRYEDQRREERRPRQHQDPRYDPEGPRRYGRDPFDGEYSRGRHYGPDRHGIEDPYRSSSKSSRYYRDKRKYGYEDDCYSDISRPSSRASMDERYSKEPSGHFRSVTPSVMSDSERGPDYYENRSNYDNSFRRYKPGGYYQPHYQDGYGYPSHYYPPMDQLGYYNSAYYSDYYRQYYYGKAPYEGDYPSQYFNYPQQRTGEEYPNQSFTEDFPKEDTSKYSHDIEQSSVVESEASIPSIHSESLYPSSVRPDVTQLDGGVTMGTYVKYQTPHCITRFSPTGKLLMVLPSHTGRPQVEIHDIQHFLTNDDTYQKLKSFPGPLIKGKTFKNEVLQICQKRLKQGMELGTDIQDLDSYILLWKFIIKLLKQNGNIDGSDVADLLLEEQEVSHHSSEQHLSSVENLSQSSDNLAANKMVGGMCQEEVTNKFREFLLYGNKTEALEFAMKHHLWGHALFLASKMDPKVHTRVLTRFANSLTLNDPLQTLYQLMSSRQPAAMTGLADEAWGDWRPHLAMVLSNPTQNQLSRSSIVSLAETLHSRGQIHAAHFCHLLVQEYGSYPTKSNKVILIGSDNSLPIKEFATLEAIQWTEIYEYALTLAASSEGEILQHLVPFKLLYATQLIDYGFVREAFNYLEIIADCSHNHYLLTLVYDIANMIRCFDPNPDPEDLQWMDTLWKKLYDNDQLADTASVSERSSIQQLDQSLEPAPVKESVAAPTPMEYNPPEVSHEQPNYYEFSKPPPEIVQEVPPSHPPPPATHEFESSSPTIPQYSPVSTPSLISEPNLSTPPTPIKIPPPAINPPLPPQFSPTAKQPPSILPPSEKKKPAPEKKRPTPAKSGSSWLGGIFSKFLPKAPNQMILPDDKNPSIIYDSEKKRWVNLAGDEEENAASQPPPLDQELNQKIPEMMAASTAPPQPGSLSKFSRPKTGRLGSNYVDVNSRDIYTAPKKVDLPPEFQMVSAPPPQATAFFNPADFSSRASSGEQQQGSTGLRNPYSKRGAV